MSYDLVCTFTDAGLSAALDASLAGLRLELTHIAIGDAGGAGYVPSRAQAGLVGERMRVAIEGGRKIDATTLQVTAPFALTAALATAFPAGLPVREVGIWAGATLVAVWSQTAAPLFVLSPSFEVGVSFALALDQFPADSITVTLQPPIVPDYSLEFAKLAIAHIDGQRRDLESLRRLDDQLCLIITVAIASISANIRHLRSLR
jgi:hypothetical protein